MNKEFWVQVEETFFEAVQLPEEARIQFLNETCTKQPDIQREVESLLEYKDSAQHLDQSAVVAAAAELFSEDDSGLIGTVVADKYLIKACLGMGGMAEIYLADHITLDTSFALKRPRPEFRTDPAFRRRFLEEARRAAILKHDNITRVHDVIDGAGDIFVVMEHIEGKTLRSRLDELTRPLTIDEFLPVAVQCVFALTAAHEKKIVHLDVKPGNIMLTPAGQVKICDFGVAKRLSADRSDLTSISSISDWTLGGTPAYMAPEVILGHSFDGRADVFSLGIVFYEMLTGYNPFAADTVVATTGRIASHDPPPISAIQHDIDPKVERIVGRMLEKDPNHRYATASDLLEDLRASQRSRRRLQDIVQSVQEVFAESRWLGARFLLTCLAAASSAWIRSYCHSSIARMGNNYREGY